MSEAAALEIAPNWTSLAGAVEAILGYLGTPLPRHAVMGLTGLAFHLCLGTKSGVTALPSGPSDLDRGVLAERLSRTGWRWERHADALESGREDTQRERAVAWARQWLDRGVPVIGWDLRLHEHCVIRAFDPSQGAFVVSDVLSSQAGALVPVSEWPLLGRIELLAPATRSEGDTLELIARSFEDALLCFAGGDGPPDGQPRGTDALLAWADALESDAEVDRAGHAYTLAVLQAARLDGASYLADVAAALPELHEPLDRGAATLREEAQALAPLVTLFPFPAAGHGNIGNAGLRRAAAAPLRRAAQHERTAGEQIALAVALLRDELATP